EQSRRLDAHLRVRRQAALENLRRQLLAAVLTEQDDRAVGAEVVEQRLVGEQLVRAWRPIEEPGHVARAAQAVEPGGQRLGQRGREHLDHPRRVEGAALEMPLVLGDQLERVTRLLNIHVDADTPQFLPKLVRHLLTTNIKTALTARETTTNEF